MPYIRLVWCCIFGGEMENRLIVFIVCIIVLVFLCIINILLKVFHNSCIKQEKWKTINNDKLETIINEYIVDFQITKGRIYAFHPNSKSIDIESKDQYTSYDLFRMLHEVSHAEDLILGKKVIYLKYVYNFILFPFFMLGMLITNTPEKIKIVIIVGMIIVAIIKTYGIFRIENRASKMALEKMQRFVTIQKDIVEKIRRMYYLTCWSQVCEEMIFIPLIVMIWLVM